MASSSRPARKVVLVVEDDPVLLMHNVATIEEAGFDVVEARNADEAIAALERRMDIAIVFTDIEMPGSMDGVRLAHAVRNRWPPVHLVLASGRLSPKPEDLPDGSRFFAKPFDTAQLVAVLRDMAQAPRPH